MPESLHQYDAERLRASPRLAIFTICSNNYLPIARILLESAAKYYPEAEIFLCLADQYEEEDICTPSGVKMVSIHDLKINDLADFTFRYDILELNTAAKPYIFIHLFETYGFDQIIYFDPDIEVFSRLSSVSSAFDAGASLVLTPHICRPSELGESTRDIIFLLAGSYNLGFLAASHCDETMEVLYWWARRLRYDCINDQSKGLFVDQRFMDLVPSFAPNCVVSHDITLNVAYWNIAQRPLAQLESQWQVNNQPLAFFHFSGVDPTDVTRLSRHGTIKPVAGTPLRMLLENYVSRIIANGYLQGRHLPYGFGKFVSGVKIPRCVRQMYRTRHQLWMDNPFESYEEILHLPAAECSQAAYPYIVTNLMKFLHDELGGAGCKLDLETAEGVRSLVAWYIEHGSAAYGLDWRMIATVEQRVNPRREMAADVSVIGYFGFPSGVAQAARRTLASLGSNENLNCEAVDVNSENQDSGSGLVQIFHVNADQLPLVLPAMRSRLPRGAYRIAVPFWELETIPEAWRQAFSGIDEIWASSRFIQKTLETYLKQPVIYMPLACKVIEPIPGGRTAFGLNQNAFLFFVAFDFLSFVERKNPVAGIMAFKLAFPAHFDDVGVVVKTQNSHADLDGMEKLRAAIGDDPRIMLIDQTLEHDSVICLMTACDCFVSLHRSEGFGLVIAEAIMLKKPVIATDYGASTELVTIETGYPVNFHMVPVAENAYPFADGANWADPDLSHAAQLMQKVKSDPVERAEKIKNASQYLQDEYGAEKILAMQMSRLKAAGLNI